MCVILVLEVFLPLQRLPWMKEGDGVTTLVSGGVIVGAIFGGRCLCRWAVRSESKDVLRGYEQWMQRQHGTNVRDDEDRQ